MRSSSLLRVLVIDTEGLTGGGATAKFLIIINSGLEMDGLNPINSQSSFEILSKILKVSSACKTCFLSLEVS